MSAYTWKYHVGDGPATVEFHIPESSEFAGALKFVHGNGARAEVENLIETEILLSLARKHGCVVLDDFDVDHLLANLNEDVRESYREVFDVLRDQETNLERV